MKTPQSRKPAACVAQFGPNRFGPPGAETLIGLHPSRPCLSDDLELIQLHIKMMKAVGRRPHSLSHLFPQPPLLMPLMSSAAARDPAVAGNAPDAPRVRAVRT